MSLPFLRANASTPQAAARRIVALWQYRVTAAGGTYLPSTVAALQDFVSQCISAGLWNKLIMVAPFCGDQLAAALVKLKTNGNSSLTNFNLVSGDFTERGSSGGLNPGALNTTKYAQWNDTFQMANLTLMVWTNAYVSGGDVYGTLIDNGGSGAGPARVWITQVRSATTWGTLCNFEATRTGSGSNLKGFFFVSNNNGANSAFGHYTGGNSATGTFTSDASGTPGFPGGIFKNNNLAYARNPLQFAAASRFLSISEALTMAAIVERLQNKLTRA